MVQNTAGFKQATQGWMRMTAIFSMLYLSFEKCRLSFDAEIRQTFALIGRSIST